MGTVSDSDAYVLLASQTATLAFLSLGILWSARSAAVYLYVLSIVLSALYFGVFAALPADSGGLGTLVMMAISIVSIGGAWLKNMSLGLLETPGYPLKRYQRGSVLVFLGALATPLLFPEPVAFSTMISLAVVGIMTRVCILAFRIGSDIDSIAARVFAALVGVQLLGLIGLTIAAIASGDSALDAMPSQSTLSVSFTLGLSMLNAALFIALVLDINIRQRKIAQEDLVALEVARSRAQEREMLLADMHDGLGSQISTARLRVERGEMSQADVANLLRECSADLHLMVDTLREQNDNLESALIDYKTRIERRIVEHGIGLSWSVQLSGAPPMAPRRMLQVLRIIQEAITNAIRHAGPNEIIVAVRYLGDRDYLVKIEDDGTGIADDMSPGRGLSNMRRRARELGGSLDIRRRAGGRGTEVVLSFEDRPV